MDKKTEMIAQPHWKTLAVQLLIWSSLLPFHKDTRVLPWLQTYLCHLNCLGFHHKDDQIDFNSFLRAEIIKHNFSLICKECPLFEVNSALSSGRNNCLLSTAGEATEVSLSRVCTLQVCPWTDNLLVVLERQREGDSGREREREKERWGESQPERIHLPVGTLQGSRTAAPLRVLKSLCGQSGGNKDTLISGNSSCVIRPNSCH